MEHETSASTTASAPTTASPPAEPTTPVRPSDPNILPSNQDAVATGAHIPQPFPSSASDTKIPVRYPRPMTAADLCDQLEKEQEAIVI